MNKKSLLIASLCLALSPVVNAQKQLWKPIYGGYKTNATTQRILQKQQPVIANKGTATAERLTGWDIYNTGLLLGSGRYKYNSGDHGSRLDNIVLNSYLEFGFDPQSTPHMPYPMNVNRSVPTLAFDTGYILLYFAPGSPDKIEFNVARSYTANLVNTEWSKYTITSQSITGEGSQKNTFAYNGNGDLAESHYFYDSSLLMTGSFVPSADQYHTYSSGRVVKDSLLDYSTGAALPAENMIYAYDGTGNLTSATHYMFDGTNWAPDAKDLYTYTANNKLRTHLSQTVNGNGITTNGYVDTFAYQGNNISYTANYTWDDNSSTWIDGYLAKNYFNTQNNLDSQIAYAVSASGLIPDSKSLYTYTSYGHFDHIKTYDYNGTGFNTTPDAQFDFQYETYNATGVNTVKPIDLGASIYPNPANDVLNIRFKNTLKGAVNMRIYNTTGQLLQATTLNGSASQAPVNQLAAGNYIVEISNNEGAQRLQFVKL